MRRTWTSAILLLAFAVEAAAQDYNVPFRRRDSFAAPNCSHTFSTSLDERIVIADGGVGSAIDFTGANGFTLCIWMDADNAGNSGGRMFDKAGSQTTDSGYTFGLVDDTNHEAAVWVNRDVSDFLGGSAVDQWAADTWSCQCVTVRHGSNDDVLFFRNGVQVTGQDEVIDSGPPADNSYDLHIGIRHDLYREFYGHLAYAQAWSEPITSESTIYNACYYPCSETTNQVFGLTLCDDSSTQTDYIGSWDGTVTGATFDDTNGPPILGDSCSE